jgi:hypothetical protein
MAGLMSKETVGSFLVTKLTNMAVWIHDETGDDQMLRAVNLGGQTLATAFAVECVKRRDLVRGRDWSGLQNSDLPVSISAQIPRLIARPQLHDKFWRYLDLFISVAGYNFQQEGEYAAEAGSR